MAHKGTGVSEVIMQSSEKASDSMGSVELTATSGSCVDAFDALWFCYSPGHQVRHFSLNNGMYGRHKNDFCLPVTRLIHRSLPSTTALVCLTPAHPREFVVQQPYSCVHISAAEYLNFFDACAAKHMTQRLSRAKNSNRRVDLLKSEHRICGSFELLKKSPFVKR